MAKRHPTQSSYQRRKYHITDTNILALHKPAAWTWENGGNARSCLAKSDQTTSLYKNHSNHLFTYVRATNIPHWVVRKGCSPVWGYKYMFIYVLAYGMWQ